MPQDFDLSPHFDIVKFNARDPVQFSHRGLEHRRGDFRLGTEPPGDRPRPGGGPAVSEDGAPVYSRMVRFVRTARERLQNLEKRFASEGKTTR